MDLTSRPVMYLDIYYEPTEQDLQDWRELLVSLETQGKETA